MQPTDADSAFDDLIRRQIIQAFGPDVLNGDEFSTAPGSYLAARAEADAEFERFKADIARRADEFAAGHTAHLIACGILPEGVALRYVPQEDYR